MKKIFYSLFLLMIIFSLATCTFASTGTTTLELVDESICTIDVNGLANFEKKITNFDKDKKEATLTLSLTNIKDVNETTKPVELFLVIDNSTSMEQETSSGETRKDLVINSANTLVDKLFEANNNAKVGVVSFSSLDSVKGETEGTINDAKLRLSLSNSKDDVKAAISAIDADDYGPRTNIEAGITLASENYSSVSNTKRCIVLLTDGCPNNSINGIYATYSGEVATRTKAKLIEIENSGISIIGAMIGLDGEKVETQTNKTYKSLAEEVFGTEENPTISKYYYISDNEIEDTIVNDIFSNLVTVVTNELKNITIVDYFPQEIIDNFNFEYVASPNIGNISTKVDTTNNSITWNIELLESSQKATVSYKLTLKNDYSKDIIDVVLPTNTKVDITALDEQNNTIEETSDVSPKVKVLFDVDDTIANTVIPQTGDNSGLLFSIIVGLIAVVSISRLMFFKNRIK